MCFLVKVVGVIVFMFYNLIGSKDEIVKVLMLEVVEWIEDWLMVYEDIELLDMVEVVVI